MKPTCANGGTNRANGGTNASFCTSGDFQFFLARGQICFGFDSAMVKREKNWKKEEKRLWPKAKRRDFCNFLQGFVFGEGNRRLFTPGAKNFSCSRRRCSCVVRFAYAWLKGQLGFERLSKSCTMSGTGKMALSLSIQAVRDDARVFRFAQRRPSDRCRWSSNDLCFSLWKSSDTRSLPLRREECLHGLFFGGGGGWEQFLSGEVIEEERKASKRQSSSDRWIEESRKKSSWVALEYTRKCERSIKRRAAPAAGTGPRNCGCEMTFETESWDRRE